MQRKYQIFYHSTRFLTLVLQITLIKTWSNSCHNKGGPLGASGKLDSCKTFFIKKTFYKIFIFEIMQGSNRSTQNRDNFHDKKRYSLKFKGVLRFV